MVILPHACLDCFALLAMTAQGYAKVSPGAAPARQTQAKQAGFSSDSLRRNIVNPDRPGLSVMFTVFASSKSPKC